MKPSGIGGMSVMEGVMMKNKDVYAVAVRKPDNQIAIEVNTHKDFSDKVKLFKLPIFRGMLAFVDSMVVGIKVLNYSASFFEEEDEKTQAEKKKKKASKAVDEDFVVEEVTISDKREGKKTEESGSDALLMAVAVLISILMSVGLFMVLPVLITGLLSMVTDNHYLISFLEGIVRLAIFIGYILLASRMKEIKRVFMYHGAEHKTINCLENGFELTVENVRWQTKQHKRCGTSFMLLVVLISLVFFMFIPTGNLVWRILSRILLVPFIAGVSYEFIRLAGKSENKVVQVISQPGLWMQGLTTKEPDDSMIEVAIQSVNAVFDWRAFLETSATVEAAAVKTADLRDTAQQSKKVQSNRGSQGNKSNKASQAAKTVQPVKSEQSSGKTVQSNKPEQPGKAVQAGKTEQSGKAIQREDKSTPQEKSNLKDKKGLEKSAKQNKAESTEEPLVSVSEKNTEAAAPSIKPQAGGLAYTGKVADTEKIKPGMPGGAQMGRNKGTAPVSIKPNLSAREEEEDDDILKALDKFFDDGSKD